MANFLERLIARSQDSSLAIRPQLPPVFGPPLSALHSEPQLVPEIETKTHEPVTLQTIPPLRDPTQRHPEMPGSFAPSRELSHRHDSPKSLSSLTPPIDTPVFAMEPQPKAEPRLRAVDQESIQSGPHHIGLRHEQDIPSTVQIAPLPLPQSSTPDSNHALQEKLIGEHSELTLPRQDKSAHQSNSVITPISWHNQRETDTANAQTIQLFVPSPSHSLYDKTLLPEPSVEVTIDRLEVHLHSTEPHRERKSRAIPPAPSLNEFLERRGRRAQP